MGPPDRIVQTAPDDYLFLYNGSRAQPRIILGKPDELDELLPQADVVFSSVPHTPASRGMLGKDQFAVMKEGVYVVNVSRGPIIDTEALVAALRSGKVRAAGLDGTLTIQDGSGCVWC